MTLVKEGIVSVHMMPPPPSRARLLTIKELLESNAEVQPVKR